MLCFLFYFVCEALTNFDYIDFQCCELKINVQKLDVILCCKLALNDLELVKIIITNVALYFHVVAFVVQFQKWPLIFFFENEITTNWEKNKIFNTFKTVPFYLISICFFECFPNIQAATSNKLWCWFCDSKICGFIEKVSPLSYF